MRRECLYFYYEKGFLNLLNPESYQCCTQNFFCNPTQNVRMVKDKGYWDQVFCEQFNDGNWGVKMDELQN